MGPARKLLFVLALVVASCANPPPAELVGRAGRALIRETGGRQFVTAHIPSHGFFNDRIAIQIGAAAVNVEGLREILSRAETPVAVVSRSSELARTTLVHALSGPEAPDLDGLLVIFVGDPPDSPYVESAVSARSGRYLYAPELDTD